MSFRLQAAMLSIPPLCAPGIDRRRELASLRAANEKPPAPVAATATPEPTADLTMPQLDVLQFDAPAWQRRRPSVFLLLPPPYVQRLTKRPVAGELPAQLPNMLRRQALSESVQQSNEA